MPHQVQALKNNVNLPNGFYIQSGQSVILDDTEFARLAQDVFTSGTLRDLGYVSTAGPSAGAGVVTAGQSVYDLPSTGILRASIGRGDITNDVAGALTTAVMTFTAVQLGAGDTITTITFPTGATAAVTPTHQWAALYTCAGASSVLLGQSTDATNAAIAANSTFNGTLTTPYVVSTSGLYYLALCVVAGTVPSLLCKVLPLAGVSTGWGGQQALCGTAGSGLAATAPNPSGAITATVNRAYAYAH